jgi:hypothetical protein
MAKKAVANHIIEIEAAVPKDYEIEYWYERDQEMPISEQNHVKESLEEGFTSGELLYDEKGNYNRGWWNIKTEDS